MFPFFTFPLHLNRVFVVWVHYLRFFSIASPIYRYVHTLYFLPTVFSFSSDWFPSVCVRSVFSRHLLLLLYCSRDLRFKFDNNTYFFYIYHYICHRQKTLLRFCNCYCLCNIIVVLSPKFMWNTNFDCKTHKKTQIGFSILVGSSE